MGNTNIEIFAGKKFGNSYFCSNVNVTPKGGRYPWKQTAKGSTLKNLLLDAKQHHAKLGNDIHTELEHCHGNTKEPSPVAKGMAWAKTNMKLTLEQSDATVANLITDGCDMGINALQRCLNDYPDASHAAKDLCRRLMSIEDTLREDLRSYL